MCEAALSVHILLIFWMFGKPVKVKILLFSNLFDSRTMTIRTAVLLQILLLNYNYSDNIICGSYDFRSDYDFSF